MGEYLAMSIAFLGVLAQGDLEALSLPSGELLALGTRVLSCAGGRAPVEVAEQQCVGERSCLAFFPTQMNTSLFGCMRRRERR